MRAKWSTLNSRHIESILGSRHIYFMKHLTQGTCTAQQTRLYTMSVSGARGYICVFAHLCYSDNIQNSVQQRTSPPLQTRDLGTIIIHTGEGGACHCNSEGTVRGLYCLYNNIPPLKLCQRCRRLPFCGGETSRSPWSRPNCPVPWRPLWGAHKQTGG
jgi:hypothetical protein